MSLNVTKRSGQKVSEYLYLGKGNPNGMHIKNSNKANREIHKTALTARLNLSMTISGLGFLC